MTDASVLLHPIRLRIAQALLSDGDLTTAQLHERLSDVPIATLYRQVNHLQKAELIEVAEEHQVRGAKERTYRLAPSFASPTEGDLTSLSKEELHGVFTVFTSGLIRDFGLYLEDGDADLVADRVLFAQADFWATEEEVDEFTQSVMGALEKLMAHDQTVDRRRRKLTTVLLPRPERDGQEENS
ncbi:helix-turn-helix domain-containing protein [Nesterenkonia ebinurensis]|uniref:helix-turn-helix domain-containing protein n=1 Tax=Nesterenkonia ebinurensis TaxID=2608252 RepID=UPI00123DA7FA|nr:helix-turn-helix domain-containing protein [Nesterenkonia ebinurensis]